MTADQLVGLALIAAGTLVPIVTHRRRNHP